MITKTKILTLFIALCAAHVQAMDQQEIGASQGLVKMTETQVPNAETPNTRGTFSESEVQDLRDALQSMGRFVENGGFEKLAKGVAIALEAAPRVIENCDQLDSGLGSSSSVAKLLYLTTELLSIIPMVHEPAALDNLSE